MIGKLHRLALLTLAILGAGPLTASAQAQTYPSRQITIVVPFPAGAGPDVMARLIGEQLTTRVGQPVIVENRPGASGLVGAAVVAKAAPDGHHLLLTPNTLFIAPHVMPKGAKPPADVIGDFTAVIMPSQTAMVMVANPGLGVKTAQEFAALAKTKPGMSFASSGAGSVLHIAGELFAKSAGINLLHVPYRGIAPAINDVVAGHVQVTFSGIGPLRQHLASGKLVALALVENKRSAALADLPTAIEQGFADVAVDGWYSVLAPRGTPVQTVAFLNRQINAIVASPDVKSRIEAMGEIVLGGTPEAASARIKADYERYGAIVERLKIVGEQ